MRYEQAAWADQSREYGCVQAAWTDESRSRLCIRFATTDGRRTHSRYLNLTCSDIEKARGLEPIGDYSWNGVKVRKLAVADLQEEVPVLALHYEVAEKLASRRPAWDTSSMTPLALRRYEGEPPTLEGGDSLGVVRYLHPPSTVCFVMNCPDERRRRAIVFEIRGRPYRTFWGRRVQVLLPLTAALDAATMPIQIPVALYCMTCGWK